MFRATLAEYVDGKVGLEVFGKAYNPLTVIDKLIPGLADADLLSEAVMHAYDINLVTRNIGSIDAQSREATLILTPVTPRSFYSFKLSCKMENNTAICVKYETLSDARKDAWLFGELAKDVPEITCIRYTRENRRNPAREVLATVDVFTDECDFWK